MNVGDAVRTTQAIGAFPVGCTGTIERVRSGENIDVHLTKKPNDDAIDFHAPALPFQEYYELI